MLNLNKRRKLKLNLSQHSSLRYACAYHYVQLSYTTQHRTVLVVFRLILQIIILAQMMSTRWDGPLKSSRPVRSRLQSSLKVIRTSWAVDVLPPGRMTGIRAPVTHRCEPVQHATSAAYTAVAQPTRLSAHLVYLQHVPAHILNSMNNRK